MARKAAALLLPLTAALLLLVGAAAGAEEEEGDVVGAAALGGRRWDDATSTRDAPANPSSSSSASSSSSSSSSSPIYASRPPTFTAAILTPANLTLSSSSNENINVVRRPSGLRAAAQPRPLERVPLQPPPDGGLSVRPASVCGANSLSTSSHSNVCQLLAAWQLQDPSLDDDSDGLEWYTCSSFRIGATALATAGHCVYWRNPERFTTDYALRVEIYCGGKVCSGPGGKMAARGVRALASPRWISEGGGSVPTPWDWAVVETSRALPGSSVRLGSAPLSTARSARVTGFPNQDTSPGAGACNNAAYNEACRQYSSTGTLNTGLVDPRAPGFYTSASVDFCPGQSGGPVYDTQRSGGAAVVAVVSGYSDDRCLNLFAPHAAESEVDPDTCERERGGSSVTCLWKKLTGKTLGAVRG